MSEQVISVIFTPKADLAMYDLINKYGLEKNIAAVAIDFICKSFAKEEISEKEAGDILQKKLNIPITKTEIISKEIINTIIPLLEKVPEEKLKDSDFADEIYKKIFGGIKNPLGLPEEKVNAESVKPAIQNTPVKINEYNTKKLKKIPALEKQSPQIPKTKRSGTDKYRESI